MKKLFLFLIWLPTILNAQEQITFYESEIITEFSRNYYYISDSDEHYLFQEAANDYYVQKIDGENLSVQAEFSAVRETYTSLCEDPRDCILGDYFIDIHSSVLRVNNFKTNETLHDFNFSANGFWNITSFSLTGGKVYLTSKEDDEGKSKGAIYDFLENTITIVEDPNYYFLGRNGSHMFYSNLENTEIYYYDESTGNFISQYKSDTEITNYFVSKSDNGHAVILQTENDNLLVFKTPGLFDKYDCSPIDYAKLGDNFIINNKLIFYDQEEYSFSGRIIIYNLEECKEEANKYINSVYGRLKTGPAFDGRFIFYESDQVSPDDFGARGVIDLENNVFERIGISNLSHFHPKYAIKNGNKVIFLTTNLYINVEHEWNNILEIDLTTYDTKSYKIVVNGANEYQSLSYGTMPYGNDITDFNVFTSNKQNGSAHYNFKYENEDFVRNFVSELDLTTGGITSIEKFSAFDNKLVFSHGEKLKIYDKKELLFSENFSETTNLRPFKKSLAFGLENDSGFKLLKLSKGSDEIDIMDLDDDYGLADKINENGYFKNTKKDEEVEYIDLTTFTKEKVKDLSIISGRVMSTNDNIVYIDGSSANDQGHYLHNTETGRTRYIGSPVKSFSHFPLSIEDNGFILDTPKDEYIRIRSNGEEKSLGEYNLGYGTNFKLTVNPKYGYLLALDFDDSIIKLFSEKDGEIQEFDVTSFSMPDIFHTFDKVIIVPNLSGHNFIYVYDFENEPTFIESTRGVFLAAQSILDKTIVFFQDFKNIIAYELTDLNTLEELASYENLVFNNLDNDRFTAVHDEENIILTLTTAEYGKELFLFNINTNEFSLLMDINEKESSAPDHFTQHGNVLYFTAEVSKKNRQWFMLNLKLPLDITDFEPEDTEILNPSLVENQIFFNSDFDEFSIFNSAGQLFKTGKNYLTLDIIDLYELGSGLYFMNGIKDNQQYTIPFYKH